MMRSCGFSSAEYTCSQPVSHVLQRLQGLWQACAMRKREREREEETGERRFP